MKQENLINEFVKTIKYTNRKLDFYVNWEKIKDFNKKDYESEIEELNKIIGKDVNKKEFLNLLDINPRIINLFPYLIALGKSTRDSLKKQQPLKVYVDINQENDEYILYLDKNDKLTSMQKEKYWSFFKDTGIKSFLEDSLITDIGDYITGVLVGLDTHARKNRSGKSYETMMNEILTP